MKKLIIAIVASLCVGGGITAGVMVEENRPQNVIVSALAEAFDDLSERDEIAPLANAFNEGSISFSVDKLKSSKKDYMAAIGIDKLSGKMYFNGEDEFYLEGLSFKDGAPAFSMYATDREFYFRYGEDAYGLDIRSALDDYYNSIFAYGSGSEYELPEEAHEIIVNFLDISTPEKFRGAVKEMEALYGKYLKKIWDLICEYGKFDEETDEITLGEEDTEARIVTLTLDADAFDNIFSELASFMENDDDLYSYYGRTHGDDADDAVEIAVEEAELLAETFAEAFDELTLAVATPKHSNRLLELTFTIDMVDEEPVDIVIDAGKDGFKDSKRITVEGIYSGSSVMLLEYEVKKNNDSGYSAVITALDEKIAEVVVDAEAESFSISVADGAFEMSGSYKKEGLAHTWVIKKISVSGSTKVNTLDTDITFVINESEDIPKGVSEYEYKGMFSSVTESDMDEVPMLLEEFLAGFENVIKEFAWPEIEQGKYTYWINRAQTYDRVELSFYANMVSEKRYFNGGAASVTATYYYEITGPSEITLTLSSVTHSPHTFSSLPAQAKSYYTELVKLKTQPEERRTTVAHFEIINNGIKINGIEYKK